MLCPSCGHENREDATFCGECATALAAEQVCAACGRSNSVRRKFCDSCAAPIYGSAASPSRTPTPQPSPALPASFAGGRYQVKRFLGEGGRKRVYLAHDTKAPITIKVSLKTTSLAAYTSFPTSVTIPRGAKEVTFSIDTPAVSTIHTGHLTASFGGWSVDGPMAVNP